MLTKICIKSHEYSYSKVPIITNYRTYAILAELALYCRFGPSYRTYNRHFRVGRVVQNDPLKLVVIVKKLLDIVGRVVKKYQKLLDTLGRWF